MQSTVNTPSYLKPALIIILSGIFLFIIDTASAGYAGKSYFEDSLPSAITDSSKLFATLIAERSENGYSNAGLNTTAKLFADDYIKRNLKMLQNMKVWGRPYFDLYERIFAQSGVPPQLKYLSVIESSLQCTAVSSAGAVGPWQIMDGVARENGLNTYGRFDERYDYTKSTFAAAQILKSLYSKFNDWLLVIAAYNCGEGGVNRAIAKANSRDFWQLQYYLPEETRNHVKKFIATHYYFEGGGSIATMTAAEAKNYSALDIASVSADDYQTIAANATTIQLYGKYNSVVIANNLMMDIGLFNRLNPDFDKTIAEGAVYPMRLPADKADLFQAKKLDILRESVQLILTQASAASR